MARELAALVGRGKPAVIVSDDREAIRRRHVSEADMGTELTSNAVLSWAGKAGINWHDIAPGKPIQNGTVESFNGLRLAASQPVAIVADDGDNTRQFLVAAG